MAFAAVVSLFASTNSTTVAAYASATSHERREGQLRASGNTATRTSAATKDRPPASCQADASLSLIATPAVDQSPAAPRIISRATRGEVILPEGYERFCLSGR